MDRLVKNNYSNVAPLKDLTTKPPMSLQRYAAIMRKRIAHRRMIEDARELKAAADPMSPMR